MQGEVIAQGDYQFSGGTEQSLTYGVHGYHADLSITYDIGSIQGSTDIKIPLRMTWPFLLGPIPMYVAFSVTLGMEATLATATDVGSGTAHLTYSGDFGFNRAGGASFTSAGGLADVNFEITDAAEAGTITAGVEALLEAPKIILGAGIPSASTVFDASLYLTVKNEVVSNLEIPDALAPGKPSCLTVSCGTGAYYGGSLTLLGLHVDQENEIDAVSRVVGKTGDACP